MDNNIKNQGGFSLVELAVVIIISGFLFATAITLYQQYLEKKRIYATQAKIDTLNSAMDRFFAEYGRYPCPADSSLGPGDVNFGVETDCSLAPPATPGISVAVGQVNDDDNLATKVATDIRKGSIPFATLKQGSTLFGQDLYQFEYSIGADDTVDTYKNKFTYVLTERQGTLDYLPRLGAIEIYDEHGTAPDNLLSRNPNNNHADYVIISHGEKADGAWPYYGNTQLGNCGTSPAKQQENCDNDDTYVSSLRYDTGANEFDDLLVFRTWANYFLWEIADVDIDIYNLNTGNVGVGGDDPQEKLHVYEGNAVADEKAVIDATQDASVLADEYCIFNAGVPGGQDCFTPDIVAGTGVNCDALDAANSGNVATVALANNTLNCDTIYNAAQNPTCGTGFMNGFTYNQATKTLQPNCVP